MDGRASGQDNGVTTVTTREVGSRYYCLPFNARVSGKMVWARLQADVNCNLRRGAWYRLIKASGLATVVDVRGTPVPVVRAFLQMSSTPPRTWTVVPRPSSVPRSVQIGDYYAVCPSCRDRVPLRGRPRRMLCGRCSVEFAFNWDEQYLTRL